METAENSRRHRVPTFGGLRKTVRPRPGTDSIRVRGRCRRAELADVPTVRSGARLPASSAGDPQSSTEWLRRGSAAVGGATGAEGGPRTLRASDTRARVRSDEAGELMVSIETVIGDPHRVVSTATAPSAVRDRWCHPPKRTSDAGSLRGFRVLASLLPRADV